MQQAEVGSHVVYTRKEDGSLASHDAVIIGYEHQVEGEELPAAHLAFLSAKQLAVLNGVDWHRAMEEVFSVPYGFSEGHHFYELDPAIKLGSELGAAQERLMAMDSVLGNNEAASQKLIAELKGQVDSLDGDLAAAKKENESLAKELTAAKTSKK